MPRKKRVKKLTICTEILVKAIWFFFVLRTSCTAPHKLYSTTIVWAEQSNARLQVAGPGRAHALDQADDAVLGVSAVASTPFDFDGLHARVWRTWHWRTWQRRINQRRRARQGTRTGGLPLGGWAPSFPWFHVRCERISVFGCSYSKFREKRTFHA